MNGAWEPGPKALAVLAVRLAAVFLLWHGLGCGTRDRRSASSSGESLVFQGERLAEKQGCLTCHSVDGRPGTGPTLKGLAGAEVELAGGEKVVADPGYLRESIATPDAKLVRGFPPMMPAYQGRLSSRELDALVAYLQSLR